MNENKMVKFRNTTPGKVIVHEPAYGVHREFLGKGTTQMIPFEVVEQLLWRPGFKNLVTSGVLYIDSMEDKIALQLEEPETKVPTKIKVLTEEQILTLLKVRSYEDFVDELATVSIDQANAIVDYAIDHSLVNPKKVDYLKKITGRDILKSIANRRDQEEAEKLEAERKERRRNEGEFNAI